MSIRWISAVWINSPYRGEHLLLHLALADFANDEGYCFPSIRTLSNKARCSQQWVRKGIRLMIQDDLLEIVEQGLGRGNVNRYLLKPVSKKRETELRISHKGETQSLEIPNSVTSDTYIQNRKEPSHDQPLSAFELFWSAYPKKVGKGLARKTFDRLMSRKNSPSIHDLLAGVERYRLSVSDPRYIAHPTSWLNAERWTDEISTPASESTRVVVSHHIQQAQSFGASFASTGRSESELLESIESYDIEYQQAAIAAYQQRKNPRS